MLSFQIKKMGVHFKGNLYNEWEVEKFCVDVPLFVNKEIVDIILGHLKPDYPSIAFTITEHRVKLETTSYDCLFGALDTLIYRLNRAAHSIDRDMNTYIPHLYTGLFLPEEICDGPLN